MYQCKEQHEQIEQIEQIEHNNKTEKKTKCCQEYFVVKQCSKTKKMIKELCNEYTIGCIVHHENIRETLDYDVDHRCIIFEHFEGIDLFELLDKNGSLHYDKSIFIIKQLLSAVDYLHSLGIAHMDIKLENIMCNDAFKIKLIDFGEAIVFCYNNKTKLVSGIYGTESCSAPEVFICKEYNADKTDIWSCGIVLYEMIYYQIPWLKAHNEQKSFKIHNIDITENRKLNKKLFPNNTDLTNNLFMGMLNTKPEKRLLSKELLAFFSN